MNQNTFGISLNHIFNNDFSFQEINNLNSCFSQNSKSLIPNDYKIEEDNFYFWPKNLSIDKELDKDISNEKTIKNLVVGEKSLEEASISFHNNEYNKKTIKIKEIEKLKKRLNNKDYLGRKKGNNFRSDTLYKYHEGNIRRKSKIIILDYAKDFLNKTIEKVYNNNIGQGLAIKKILPLNGKMRYNSTIQHNKNILNKTLAEIFSQNISKKYKYYPTNHNCALIQRLLNEEDEKKKKVFQKIFNLTFIQCLKSFIGNDTCEELKDLKKFCEIKSKLPGGTKYINDLENYLKRFQEIIDSKKARKRIIQKNEKKEKSQKK